METQKLVIKPGEDLILVDGQPISRRALLLQLDKMLESRLFRNSKRYPAFFRFVVERTLAGSPDSLKERNLGVEVFARAIDYDTNADPIVRVTAGEIRKRIAQYYQEAGHGDELRIDLPVGTYVPHFESAAVAAPVPAEVPKSAVPEAFAQTDIPTTAVPAIKRLNPSRRWTLLTGMLLTMALLALAWTGVAHAHGADSGLNSVWQPALASLAPATIVIGVHSLDSQGREERVVSHAMAKQEEPEDMLTAMVRSDMVPISDIVSYSRVTDLLTSHTHAYTTMGSADASLEDLRKGPLILIGGLDNLWTMRMTSGLRFGFTANGSAESAITDRQHPDISWRFDNMQHAIVNTRDYAIVASYFDSTIDQPVLIIAGIGKAGTQVAAEFITSRQDLAAWLKQQAGAQGTNIELVLSTEILDGRAGPPRVVASTTW